MVSDIKAAATVAPGLPADVRARIVSGIRWTLWLSVLSAPCGYATTILLAHVSPEAIGTYGLLFVYIGLTSVFLFWGGNAVAIKFLPEIAAEKRLSFLISYFLVTCGTALPLQLAASLWPDKLRYLFGQGAGTPFEVFILWVAPVYILFSLALAALKGMMEIGYAQILARVITLGSFATYVLLFVAARPFLATHYTGLIWGIYFGLAIFATLLALKRLLRMCGWEQNRRDLRFFLPAGFWRFSLGLQASSVFGFLSTRLDYVLVLNAGGLAVLGKYVALMTLVSIIPVFATFVLDSLLPSLTNTLALGDLDYGKRLVETYLRIIMPCGLGAACFLMLFAGPVTRVLGHHYESLARLMIVAIPFAAMKVLSWFAGTVLSAIGQPHRNAVAQGLQTAVMCGAFWVFWPRYRLIGAVLAWGMSEVCYQCVGLYLLLRKMPFSFSLLKTYGPFLLVTFSTAAVAKWIGERAVLPSGLWIGAVLVFLLLSRYTLIELAGLRRVVWKGNVSLG